MGNASKLLQTVCANLDQDMVGPNLEDLFDMILLTDTTGILTGEEEVVPKGVIVAMQKETMRSRQIEFLQTTANPLDMQIIGPKGRANVLRSVASTIGLDGEEVVPSNDQMEAQQAQAEAIAQMNGAPGAMQQHPEGGPPPANQAQGNPAPGPSADNAGPGKPRFNAFQKQPGAAQ